jgi:hypothetical protein
MEPRPVRESVLVIVVERQEDVCGEFSLGGGEQRFTPGAKQRLLVSVLQAAIRSIRIPKVAGRGIGLDGTKNERGDDVAVLNCRV